MDGLRVMITKLCSLRAPERSFTQRHELQRSEMSLARIPLRLFAILCALCGFAFNGSLEPKRENRK